MQPDPRSASESRQGVCSCGQPIAEFSCLGIKSRQSDSLRVQVASLCLAKNSLVGGCARWRALASAFLRESGARNRRYGKILLHHSTCNQQQSMFGAGLPLKRACPGNRSPAALQQILSGVMAEQTVARDRGKNHDELAETINRVDAMPEEVGFRFIPSPRAPMLNTRPAVRLAPVGQTNTDRAPACACCAVVSVF